MQVYTVSFFGHRFLYDIQKIERRMIPILKELIRSKSYISFMIGRNGEFDKFVASIIKRIQKEDGNENSDLTLVLPYMVADIKYYEMYYDSVVIPDCVNGVHPKSAISLKNRWMIERSDLVVVFVDHEKGGAYASMRYAKQLNKKIINIGTYE